MQVYYPLKKLIIVVIVIAFESLSAAVLMYLTVTAVNRFVITAEEVLHRAITPDFQNYLGVTFFFTTATILFTETCSYISRFVKKYYLVFSWAIFLSIFILLQTFTFGIQWKDIYLYTELIPLLISISMGYYFKKYCSVTF
jgi:hypothetical protein